jgi:hypothetical protein
MAAEDANQRKSTGRRKRRRRQREPVVVRRGPAPRAKSSNVLIHGLVLVDPLAVDTNPKVLKALAEATGGETSDARQRSRRLRAAFERIAGAIRHVVHDWISTPATPRNDGQLFTSCA